MPAKPWPPAPEVLPYEQLVGPIKRTLMAGYHCYRRKDRPTVPYDGYELGPVGRACDSTVGEDRFQESYLAYHAARDRSLLDVILSTLFQLGFEQGRRDTMAKMQRSLERLAEFDKREDREREERAAKFALLPPEEQEARRAATAAMLKKMWEEVAARPR